MPSGLVGCTSVADPDRVDNVLLEAESGDPRPWSGDDDDRKALG